MKECICNSCKHLKSVVNEKNPGSDNISDECEFGFPSDGCIDCELDGCDLTCEHYEEIEEEDEVLEVAHCAKCGKELPNLSADNDNSEVYCVTCYLNRQ